MATNGILRVVRIPVLHSIVVFAEKKECLDLDFCPDTRKKRTVT